MNAANTNTMTAGVNSETLASVRNLKPNRFHLKSVPVNVEVSGPVKLINRAEAIVMESLILATRLSYLPGQTARESLKENHRVVGKVAPGSQYEKILGKLVEAFSA